MIDETRTGPAGASFIAIADPDDPRIAPFRNIRERDLTRRDTFIAEGSVVVRSLLASPSFEARCLLILRNRLAGIAGLLENVPAEVPVYVASGPVIDAVAGFAVHRGVLALGARRVGATGSTDDRLAASARRGGVVVAAIGVANHDNMGGIFRNAAAFAADMVLVDETSCDPLYRKAIRVSAGAVLGVPFDRTASPALPERLARHGFRLCALSPQGTRDVAWLADTAPTALFLGSEGTGLPPELMAAMHAVRIDMAPGFDSLNVATSAGIALQRLYSARRSAGVAVSDDGWG